ncbi:hypothetical protein CTA1_8296 [Colletotrichum tanaceti]|uniref:Uncharacterized protein n=1 Tax=Colletotrichum tanaceti TaxID=1306861 RepID=A0A4U6X6B6_9PEZI|nr:hypothetical protein CTA1_8296 [Colletotrichum tanaceti]
MVTKSGPLPHSIRIALVILQKTNKDNVYSNIFCDLCSLISARGEESIPILQLASQILSLVLLEQHLAVRVGVEDDAVERVVLARALEHVLVDLAVVAAQAAVEHPVVEPPGVDEADGVGADLLQQGHDGLGPGEGDLADGDGGGAVELAGLLLEGVEGVEAEEPVQQGDGGGVEAGGGGRVVEGLVEVLDDHVLGVGGAEAPEVNEQAVPRLLVLVAVAEGLEGQEGHAPGEGGDEVLVGAEDVEGGADVAAAQELGEDARRVVVAVVPLEDGARRLEEVAGHLLREHVVVALPRQGRQVVGVPRADAAERGVAVAAAGAAADLEPLAGDGGAVGLEGARGGVQVGEEVGAGAQLLGAGVAGPLAGLAGAGARPLLVLVVQVDHAAAGEVQGKGGGQQGQQADLHHGVVEHLVLARLVGRRVAVLELAADGAVAGGDGDALGEDGARLEDDVGPHPRQGAVDQRGVGRSAVPARVGVDGREAGEHVVVRDLDVVEEQEAVVHGVVAELGPDVADVDVGEKLVGLLVADGHDEGVRADVLAVEDQLGHDDGVGGGPAQGTDPPLGGSQMRRVQDKRLVGGVPRGRGLQATDVGAVAEFGLGVASEDLVVLGRLEEELVLLRGALLAQGDEEHARMESIGRGLGDEVIGNEVFLVGPVVLLVQLEEPLAPCQGGLDPGLAAAEVVLRLVKDGVLLEDVEYRLAALEGLLREHEGRELIDVEVGLCSLLSEELGALRAGGLEGLDPIRGIWHLVGLVRRWRLG